MTGICVNDQGRHRHLQPAVRERPVENRMTGVCVNDQAKHGHLQPAVRERPRNSPTGSDVSPLVATATIAGKGQRGEIRAVSE